MDKLKKFIGQKKVDRHFKRTTGGAKLSDGPSTSRPSVQPGTLQGSSSEAERVHAADVAAMAALKRLHANEPAVSNEKKKIQMMAQRELEKERREKESSVDKFKNEIKNLTINQPEVREFEHSQVIPSLKFTCELLENVVLPKDQLRDALETFLLDQMAEEGVLPAVLMISSLNNSDSRTIAVETIGKYLQNIIQNPQEPKFRRIRLANKAFKERVESVKGGREFLLAVGFVEKVEEGAEGTEKFLVMPEPAEGDEMALIEALDALQTAVPIPLKVARDTKIFTLRENERITSPKLPPDFFSVAAKELKNEQEAKEVAVDRLTTMRTREMREKDSTLRDYRYKYTLMRVRTPDRMLIQGVFSVHECLQAVREWVHSLLAAPETEFALAEATAGGTKLDESKTLAEVSLVPAAVLHFSPLSEPNGPTIAEEYMQEAMPFTID